MRLLTQNAVFMENAYLENDEDAVRITRKAFILTSILSTPFWAIYTLLLFILYKDLHASPFQITVFVILRPLVSIFSLYWSARVKNRPDRLLPNIMWAGILGSFPFLFFPFIDNPWYFIGASALYMTLVRGVFPAWMEVLKLNLPSEIRKQTISYATTISFVGGGVLSLLIGWMLDDFYQVWRLIFPVTAILNMVAIAYQYRIPIASPKDKPFQALSPVTPLRDRLLDPWNNVWDLLNSKVDFRNFHIGYMLGGFGLVIIQPALPHFFMDQLHLSYTELTTAITFCKGIAFAFASPIWARWLNAGNIFRFSSLVAFLAGLSPLLLVLAQINLSWIFIAYLLYGVMQSGSELSWHLAGPIFSQGEDSSTYSSVNLAVVGLRGCVAPLMGGMLLNAFSPDVVLIVGALFSFSGSFRLYLNKHPAQESISNLAIVEKS